MGPISLCSCIVPPSPPESPPRFYLLLSSLILPLMCRLRLPSRLLLGVPRIGGNRFHQGENYPPWKFPLETMPNISSSPSTESSAIESHPSHKVARHKKKGLGPGGITCMVGGATLLATCAAFVVVISFQRSRERKLGRLESTDGSWQSTPMSTARDCSSTEDSPAVSAINSSPLIDPRHLPLLCTKTVRVRRRSFAKKSRIPIGMKLYSVAELQTATWVLLLMILKKSKNAATISEKLYFMFWYKI